MEQNPLIHAEQISFGYPREPRLFENVSFTIKAGSFYLVRGPSGSGKSSLLRILNRLEEPLLGDLSYEGTPYASIPAPFLRRRVLYIQQTPTVTDGTVRDNLLLPFSFRNNRNLVRPEESRIRELLDEFSLTTVDMSKSARTLSVGQQQRLCLIRGLLLSPCVILLDEPTSALDEESAQIVEDMAESLCMDKGKAIVMVSHRDFNPRKIRPVDIHIQNGSLSLEQKALS